MSDDPRLAVRSWFSMGWSTYKGNPRPLIGGSLILGAAGLLTLFGLGGLFLYFYVILPPLLVGIYSLCLKLVRRQEVGFSEVFTGFRHFGKAWITCFLFALFVGAGGFLLVIPGIIWALKYSFGWFAVLDKSLSPREALRFSGKITQGYKRKLLGAVLVVIVLSLLGMPFALGLQQLGTDRGQMLMALGIIPYLVGVFVTGPWIGASYASAYDALVAVYEENQVPKEVAG